MNFPSLLAGRLRIAAPPLLAVLLTIALAGPALAQQPPHSPGGPPSDPGTGQPSANPPVNPPASPPVNPPGGPPTTDPPVTQPVTQPVTPPTDPAPTDPAPTDPAPTDPAPTDPAPTDPAPTDMAPTDMAPHPSAPFTPPAGCVVAHAATPAQLCPMAGGLQYYFIGAVGSAQPGPWIQPFSELASLHTAGAASLYSGANSKSGKSIQIYYLPAENILRISTYYPDNQYDTNKPYIFTVDSSNNVTHEAW